MQLWFIWLHAGFIASLLQWKEWSSSIIFSLRRHTMEQSFIDRWCEWQIHAKSISRLFTSKWAAMRLKSEYEINVAFSLRFEGETYYWDKSNQTESHKFCGHSLNDHRFRWVQLNNFIPLFSFSAKYSKSPFHLSILFAFSRFQKMGSDYSAFMEIMGFPVQMLKVPLSCLLIVDYCNDASNSAIFISMTTKSLLSSSNVKSPSIAAI